MVTGSTPPAGSQSQCAPEFAPLLRQFDRRSLDDHPGVVFGLWEDYRLAYVNAAWFRFAAENGGEPAISSRWPLGSCVMDAVPADLQPYYRYLYALANVRNSRAAVPLCHEYACSSPETYRRFAMHVFVLPGMKGFLVMSSLLIERAHDPGAAVASPRPEDYLDENGMYCQCSHCRRFRRSALPERWDWIPEWVRRQPARTSHSLCRICFDYYYGNFPPLGRSQAPPGADPTEA